MFSRLRYIGYSILCPATLLFISSITKTWTFLIRKSVILLLFVPALLAIMASLNLIPNELLVTGYRPFSILGLSVVRFENGPLFYLYYGWSNLLITLALSMLVFKIYSDKHYRQDYQILSLGMACGYLIDLYGVFFNPLLRFTMLSAGTFLISQFSFFYVLRKNSFFGLVETEEELSNKYNFQKKLLSLVGHDLAGNIHQLARLSNKLTSGKEGESELIKVINDTSLSSAELISNVMRWVKSQEGSDFKVNYESVNLKDLLQGLIDSLAPVYSGIKEYVTVEVSEESLFLTTDKEMISSILRNLLTNAYKASTLKDEKDRRIKVIVSKMEEKIHFEISDNGSGLEATELENLFNEKKMKHSVQGYGIGLYLVKMMVNILGGSIIIKSKKNEGTQVYLSLPL